MLYETEKEACRAWIETFNRIPIEIVEKLQRAYLESGIGEDIYEITLPVKGDRVYIHGDEWAGHEGEIIATECDGEADLFAIKLDKPDKDGNEVVTVSAECFYFVNRDDVLPMWGTMWAFNEQIDNDWLSNEFGLNGLRLMSDCGFRIYEQEDYGYIFGIDGAGYDFYEQHWLPLYRARGLHWHKEPSI